MVQRNALISSYLRGSHKNTAHTHIGWHRKCYTIYTCIKYHQLVSVHATANAHNHHRPSPNLHVHIFGSVNVYGYNFGWWLRCGKPGTTQTMCVLPGHIITIGSIAMPSHSHTTTHHHVHLHSPTHQAHASLWWCRCEAERRKPYGRCFSQSILNISMALVDV